MGKAFSKQNHVTKNKKSHQSRENDDVGKTKTKQSRSWKRKRYLNQMKRDREAQHVSEEQMYRLSRDLTKTAWYLGRRLGMNEESVRKILWSEPNEKEAKLKILMTWRKRNGWRATNQNLVILLELGDYTHEEYKSILPDQSNGRAAIYEKANEVKERKPNGYFRYDDFASAKYNGIEKKQSSVNQSTDDIIDFARRSWKKPSREQRESKKLFSGQVLQEEIQKKRKPTKKNEKISNGTTGQILDEKISENAPLSNVAFESNLRNSRHSNSDLKNASWYNSESELNAIFEKDENEINEEDQTSDYKEQILRISKSQFEYYQHQGKDVISSGYAGRKFFVTRADSRAIYNPDQQISGLALTKDDQIVVAESNNKEIQVFDKHGEFLRSFPTQSDLNPKGVGINRDGDVVVCCGKELRIFSTNGNLISVFGQGSFRNNCYSVECDAIGTYYVSDIVGHSISVFDVNGGIRKRFGNLGEKLGNFNQPVALAINKENKLFISDSQNHCIKIYSLAGRPLEQIGEKGSEDGKFWSPFGLCFDKRGHLLVADCGNNRISLFSEKNYKFLRHVLTEKDGLQMPSFIRVTSSGQMVVCEWNKSHVKIYSFESAV